MAAWPQQPATAAAPAPAVEAWRVKRSLGRAWGFSILSFGLWTVHFLYVTRQLIDREIGDGRDDATFHTVGMFIPILNFFVAYWLWRDLSWLRQRVGLPPFEVGLYVAGTVVGGAPVTYSLALVRLNEYWDARSQGWAGDAPMTTGEKAVVAVGAAFWVFYLLLIVLTVVLALSA